MTSCQGAGGTGTLYTYAQLEGLWIGAGGSKSLAPLMAAIAMAESGGCSAAENPTDNNGTQTSWGLWQISNGTHSQPVANILSPTVNAQQAVAKYQSQGLGAWGTYTSGAYKQYMSNSTTPDMNIQTTAADKSTSTSTSASTKAIEACLVAFPNLNKIPSWVPVLGTSTYACIISKSEARGVIGGLCLIGGGITGAVGLAFIAVFALGKSGVAQTVVKAVR